MTHKKSRIGTAALLFALIFPQIAAADQFVLQFSGDNLPKKLNTAVITEKWNNAECDPPCQLGQTETKFVRSAEGVAQIVIDLPADATRVCVQMWNPGLIGSATMVMKDGRRIESELGGNLNADRKSACTFAQTDAKKAWGFLLTMQ